MADKKPCEICGSDPAFRWTDTHGVGACLSCGAPYRLYHYEKVGDEEKRVDKPPQLLLKSEYIEPMRRYWSEKRRNVAPGAFNFPGSSYEVATQEDADSLRDWLAEHPVEA